MISLRKKPGATVLTRMPWRAHCTASSAVSPDSPALAAAYEAWGMPGTPTRPLMDDTLTIAPRPAATMWGNTAWHSRKGATRLRVSVSLTVGAAPARPGRPRRSRRPR